MPRTKMWLVFYVAIGAGMAAGIVLYVVFYSGASHTLVHYPAIGALTYATVGLLIGFSYYVFFKLMLRAFTWPFLRRAQALVTRPIAPLLPVWSSSELDKLEEILTEALATLERLDLFSNIAREIVATLDPQRTLGRIVATAVESLPADSGLVFLLDEENQQYTVHASYLLPLSSEEAEQVSFAAGEGVPGWVITQGRPLIIAEAQLDERVHPIIRQAGVQSLLSAPLVVGDRPLGALNLFNYGRSDAFDENDLRLVGIYADLAAVVIDNARLYREAEDERDKLTAILNDTTDAVVVLDQAGWVLLLNPAAERRLEVQFEQSVGQPVAALGVDDLGAALEAAQAAATSVVREVVVPGGRTLYASVSPVRELGWVMVMQDITPLKELDRLRTEWVAAVSHDLKNPITAIQLSVDLLERIGPLSEEQRQMLRKTQRGTERLRSLVTDVLDLARLEAGPALRASAVNLAEVVAEALTEVEPLVAEKQHHLTTDLPPDLPLAWGDVALLTRALVNLLSNAVKFTPAEGQVTVRAYPQDGVLQIEVSDTGRGIPAEALPHLFDRFYRVPGSEEETEGTGLGLSIVKSIIEKHGGRVWVESELDKGSTFAFTVPVSKERASDIGLMFEREM